MVVDLYITRYLHGSTCVRHWGNCMRSVSISGIDKKFKSRTGSVEQGIKWQLLLVKVAELLKR